MTDVFISYKREEREQVVLIADRLRALGLDVWFDARLATGHHFDREIDQHVRKAKCVLVCWSQGALNSEWVRAEAAIGRERGVIVPLMIEMCSPPVPFNTLQTENLIGWSGDGDHPGWLNALQRIGDLTKRGDIAAAERERGAREVETRRIQAMLDAQRREEEQARRAAETAAAERTRLEAELAARGASPPPARDRAPLLGSLGKSPRTSSAPNTGAIGKRLPISTIISVVVALLLASGVGVIAYIAGTSTGRSDAEWESSSSDRRRSAAALEGDWCWVSGPAADVSIEGNYTLRWRQSDRDWTYIYPTEQGSFGARYTEHANGTSHQNAFYRIGDQMMWLYQGRVTTYRLCGSGPPAIRPPPATTP